MTVQKKKRKDGRYRSKVTLPSGKQKDVYGRTQKELKKKKDKLLLQYARGATNIDGKITVQEWGLKWWQADKEGKTGNKSQAGYRSDLNNHIFPYMGTMKLIDIRPITCQELINKMGKAGLSTSLQYKVRMTMRKMFTYAQLNGLIESNPAQFTNLYEVPAEEREALTPAETTELLKICPNCSWRAELAVHLALYCGLRREEIVALEHEDIFSWTVETDKQQPADPDSQEGSEDSASQAEQGEAEPNEEYRVLFITRAVEFVNNRPKEKGPKSKAGTRIIPIPPHVWELLQKAPKDTQYVIPSAKGVQMSETAFRRLMEPVQRRVKFKVTAHMLRHTYATNLDKLQVGSKASQYLMGHADYRPTFNIYTHFQDEHLDIATKQLKDIYTISITSSIMGGQKGVKSKMQTAENLEPMGGFEPPTC